MRFLPDVNFTLSFRAAGGAPRGERSLGPFGVAKRCAAARQAARYESPAEMMPMAFEQYPALSGRACRIKPTDRLATSVDDLKFAVDAGATVGKDDPTFGWTKRTIRRAINRCQSCGEIAVVFRDCLFQRTGRHRKFFRQVR